MCVLRANVEYASCLGYAYHLGKRSERVRQLYGKLISGQIGIRARYYRTFNPSEVKVIAESISLWSSMVACRPPENTSSCVLNPDTALSSRCMSRVFSSALSEASSAVFCASLACAAAPVAVDCAACALLYAAFAAS